jgi:hypothetical protein
MKKTMVSFAVLASLLGASGCGKTKEPITETKHPIVSIAVPEICESGTRLELEGRFKSPVIYCKDKIGRQVSCDLEEYHAGTLGSTCYVLEK